MRRNYIDHDDMVSELRQLLDASPASLTPHLPDISRLLFRRLPELPFGIRALPEISDPKWAHQQAERGLPLYRLGAHGLLEIRKRTTELLFDIEKLALTSADHGHPKSRVARRRLRGIAHWKLDSEDHYWRDFDPLDLSSRFGLKSLIEELDEAAKRQRASMPYTTPRRIQSGALVAVRATTLDEILAIGKEGRNCLNQLSRAWESISRDSDIWAVRSESGLVAIVEVDSEGVVFEMGALHNGNSYGAHLPDLIEIFRLAGFKIGRGISIQLSDVVPDYMRLENDDDEAALLQLFDQMLARAA